MPGKDNKNTQQDLILFKAIVEYSHAVIGAKDIAGRYLYVNSEYSRLFHVDRKTLIGRSDADIFPADIAQQFREADLAAQHSSDGIIVEEQAPVDGETRDFLSIKFPIRNNDGDTYATGTIATDITDMKKMQQNLQMLAERDVLTDCYNRRKLLEIIGRQVDSARRYVYPLTILMVDIDHFKQINDTFGHACGDAVLKQFVTVCNEVLRQQDILGRVGGEEFLVALPHTNAVRGTVLAARLQHTLAQMAMAAESGEDVSITISIGIAELCPTLTNIDQLLHAADTALYQAKSAGRNCSKTYLAEAD
jgi:diguanylate cyclase (GGDEF)-like protein/PAS domain S-box-containing protein